jgi:hypothetical protein
VKCKAEAESSATLKSVDSQSGKKANQPVIALTACGGNIFLFAVSALIYTSPATTQHGYF